MNNYFFRSRVFYVLFSLLSVTHLFLAKVNPQPGENLWRLTARIGECIDVADTKLAWIESQNDLICSKVEKVDGDLASYNDIVCSKLENVTSLVEKVDDGVIALCSKIEQVDVDLASYNDVVCSKLESISSKIDELDFAGTCETLIFQSDIPFTITEPGVYCLAESVTFSLDTAITIASDNILLDLNEKKIDGSSGGSVGIAINSGLQNITIQNGTLCNMNDKGINADATNNLVLIPASISDSLMDSIIDIPTLLSPIKCLQIKDVKVTDVGIFKVFPIVSATDSLIDSIVDSIIDSVVDVTLLDCTLSPITGINVNCVVELLLDNCHVFGCQGDGVALQMVEHGLIQSCNALRNAGNGFVMSNVDTNRFKWCESTMNCFNGFCDTGCAADNTYLGCTAKQNGIDGFHISGGGKVVQECVASQNTRNGFDLSTLAFNDADLDPTFGLDGKVTTPFTGLANALGVAQQKDGKLVVVGSGDSDFAVARYNANGSLDTSFGIGGIVKTNFSGGIDGATGVVIQDDGKIVVCGVSDFGSPDFAVARYNIDGSLDISFGVDGKVTTLVSGVSLASEIALQKDGKIVVTGVSDAMVDANFATVRYNTDGSLDENFGIGGIVITVFDQGKSSSLNSVAIQKDGKIVVVGGINQAAIDFVVIRYNPDGSLDGNFGVGGIVKTTFENSNNGNANAVAIQKNGKIVVAGFAEDMMTENVAVARYNQDGSLDFTFNSSGPLPGTVTTNIGGVTTTDDVGSAVAIQKDGKIVVVGTSENNFAVLRYRTDGILDKTFNPTGSLPGTVTTNFFGEDRGNTVVLQKDGKIVVTGVADAQGADDWAIARYIVLKQGVAVKDCVAEENGEDGFNIVGSAYLVRDSSAIHNASNGFSLESLTDGCQLLGNQALENGNSGFFLESLTDNCQLISNSALQNINVGIENLGFLNQIFNSRAHNNAGGDYVGITLDVKPPIATTGFWANIRGV